MQQIEEKNQAKSQSGFEPVPTNTTSLWLTTSTARLSHPDVHQAVPILLMNVWTIQQAFLKSS